MKVEGGMDGVIDRWEAVALHLGIKATYRQGVEENSSEDEGLKKWEKLRCRDVCSQEGRERENEQKELGGKR